MPFRLTQKRRQPEPPPAPPRPAPSPLDVVLAYHETTKHAPYRYARSLGYMDWDTQPNPFRRYAGARLVALDEIAPGAEPSWDTIFQPGTIIPRLLDRRFLSQLFYDSLALSAWKEYGDSRWALRVNPSSGNLHPTEGYLISGPVAGLLDSAAVCHYAPHEHGLEVRRTLTAAQWQSLAEQLPPGALLLALTSIHWREAWKYGERAFRYCNHDIGHAIAAVAIAAAVMGWQVRLLETAPDAHLATLLGITGQADEEDEHLRIEAEHPDCLLVLYPATDPAHSNELAGINDSEATEVATTNLVLPASLLAELTGSPAAGTPNRLSSDHHPWPIIEVVAEATAREISPEASYWHHAVDSASHPVLLSSPPARQIIRQRRSAVDMDGVTSMSCDAFYTAMSRVLPGQTPFDALPWKPAIHLALFVHRVDNLASGLYFLLRDPEEKGALQATMNPQFLWQQPASCPETLPLYLLQTGDMRQTAQAVSCGQEIASDGAFALGMLAEYEASLHRYGPWFYCRLHWEAGTIGQMLYLEAEAAGLRATGIGCFFDDSMHQVLGLPGYRTAGQPSLRYQTVYHFTVGGPVEDSRLRTLPAYAHLGR